MNSSRLERFRYAFFEDPYSARDYLDVETAEVLTGKDRARAETMLLEFLPDLRAVIGLGVIRSARAKPVLQTLFEQSPDADFSYRRVEIAKALFFISREGGWLAFLCDALRLSREWTARMEAARALGRIAHRAAVAALADALADRDRLVRHHAAQALLALHDLPGENNDPTHVGIRIMSAQGDVCEEARREILAAIADRKLVVRE